MEGIHEPSQALLDECAHQYDTKVIRYIEPATCNSRELEISVGKSDRKLRIETNSLTIRETKILLRKMFLQRTNCNFA